MQMEVRKWRWAHNGRQGVGWFTDVVVVVH